jgi:hypothetical protein
VTDYGTSQGTTIWAHMINRNIEIAGRIYNVILSYFHYTGCGMHFHQFREYWHESIYVGHLSSSCQKVAPRWFASPRSGSPGVTPAPFLPGVTDDYAALCYVPAGQTRYRDSLTTDSQFSLFFKTSHFLTGQCHEFFCFPQSIFSNDCVCMVRVC